MYSSHVKLTSYVRMLAKANTTRVPGKSYCQGDSMCLCRTFWLPEATKGNQTLASHQFPFLAGAVRLGSGPTQSHPRAAGDSTIVSSGKERVHGRYMAQERNVCVRVLHVPKACHRTPHIHTHLPRTHVKVQTCMQPVLITPSSTLRWAIPVPTREPRKPIVGCEIDRADLGVGQECR